MAETRISLHGIELAHGSDDWSGFMVGDVDPETESHLRRPRIPKVPQIAGVTKPNEKCYQPLIVSIGPYHHENPELQEMNKTKVRMARQFVGRSRGTFEELYNKVEAENKDAKQFYAEDETKKLDDKKFTKMMFIDGCFILQFIFCLLRENENLKMPSHVALLVIRDMLLLENQLPFQVVRSLMGLGFKDDQDSKDDHQEGMKLIKDFIKHVRAMPRPRDSCRKKISNFFRKTIWRGLVASNDPKGTALMEEYVGANHLLELFHMHFVDRNIKIDRSRTSFYRYHPAMELRRVGIHFKPSKKSQFTDVQFTPTLLAGRLQVPPLTIDDSTKSLLLNLVAYEALASIEVPWVTSYICFMDSLIDHPEDVRELRSQGVLLITLGSEEEVAKLFNEVANYLVPNPYAFITVKRGIESHYRNIFKRWILHYKGPFYTVVFKYSFIFGLIVSALKYVKVFPTEPLYGVCRLPDTNGTLHP